MVRARRRRSWRLGALFVLLATLASLVMTSTHQEASAATLGTGPTLVLYDNSGPWSYLGEQYAILTMNLVSRFGPAVAKPISQYQKGDLASARGTIYVGSTYGETLPTAFMDDVIADTGRLIWANHNIWQLFDYQFASTGTYFVHTRGWQWTGYDTRPASVVSYKGADLKRYSADASGLMGISVDNPTLATTLATVRFDDGTNKPWAVKSGNLTYVSEIPYTYMQEGGKYLAFSDLLFSTLGPSVVQTKRALIRLEDISPGSDAAEIKAAVDVLYAEKIPFAFQIIPEYRDPQGVYNNGVPETITLAQAPAVVSALKYAINRGGVPVMHGYTHQLDGVANPYNQVTGDDFEFYTAYVDAQNFVRLNGPVPGETAASIDARLNAGLAALKKQNIVPGLFTTPHYAGSPLTYARLFAKFPTVVERRLYFSGQLSGAPDTSRLIGQYFPFPVKDLYGQFVLPENLGNIEPDAFNNNPPRTVDDLLLAAKNNLVVTDAWASFFFHPYLMSDARVGAPELRRLVRGIKSLGYTFVNPKNVLPTSIGAVPAPGPAPLPTTTTIAATTTTVTTTAVQTPSPTVLESTTTTSLSTVQP